MRLSFTSLIQLAGPGYVCCLPRSHQINFLIFPQSFLISLLGFQHFFQKIKSIIFRRDWRYVFKFKISFNALIIQLSVGLILFIFCFSFKWEREVSERDNHITMFSILKFFLRYVKPLIHKSFLFCISFCCCFGVCFFVFSFLISSSILFSSS